MTIAQKRQEIADAVDAALPDVKMHAYRPKGVRGLNGWLELTQADTEDATYNELRLSYNVVILLGPDQGSFEKFFDVVAADLLTVLADHGRGVTLRPAVEPVDAAGQFCLVATFITESEAA